MKEFSVLAILSVTTGRLLTRPKSPDDGNGIGQVYELLGWMTDDEQFTHQLPRFSEECKPWLERWFPDIAAATDEVVAECEAGRVDKLCSDMVARFGETRNVGKIPRDDHDVIPAYDELVAMRGTDEGIVVL